MRTCIICEQPTTNAYAIYFGKKLSQHTRQPFPGMNHTVMNIAFNSLPMSVTFCNNCVSKKLRSNDLIAKIRFPIMVVSMFVLIGIGTFGFMFSNNARYIIPLVIIAGIVFVISMGLNVKSFRGSIDLMGEKMALDELQKELRNQGYDYVMTAGDFYINAVPDWDIAITQMIRHRNVFGLLYAVDFFSLLYTISEDRQNKALYALRGLYEIGDDSTIIGLEDILEKQKTSLEYARSHYHDVPDSKIRMGERVFKTTKDTINLIRERHN